MTILLDWMCRSRRRVSALWMIRAGFVREVKVASEPEALLKVLRNPAYRFKLIGLEAGPLSQWLFSALAEAGLPVICGELLDKENPIQGPWCRFRRKARARERHRHCAGGGKSESA